MEGKFVCPHCKESLVIGKNIVVNAVTRKGKEGQLILEPKMKKGVFKVEHDEKFRIENKTHIFYHCTHCDENLVACEETNNLQKIMFIDNSGEEFEVFFSRILESQCTYVMRKSEVEVVGENLYADHFRKLLYRKYGIHNTKLTPR